MYAAFAATRSSDLSCISSDVVNTMDSTYTSVDFNKNSDPIELRNAAEQLIANIASIKDHLQKWCLSSGKIFTGKALLNKQGAAAIIHDLWNVQKHGGLDRKPQSKFAPDLRNLAMAMRMTSGTQEGAGTFWQLDPLTGITTSGATGGGKIDLVLTAEIIDDAGEFRCQFRETCEAAAEEWMVELKAVGVIS